jgi:CheY-like chemotaxis protein
VPASRPLRVLVVDDERDTLMTLGILLRSEGIDTRLTARGTEVAAMVADFRPDAILLDIGMPDRSGLQVALDLTRDHGPQCPVLIAITAHSGDAAKRITQNSGFRHCCSLSDP